MISDFARYYPQNKMQNNNTLVLLKIISDCIFNNNPEASWQNFSTELQLELIAEADKFNLRRILYYYLKELFPKEIIRPSKIDFVTFAAKSMQREKAIADLQHIFNDNKIDFRLVKGAFLASNIYPHPALRYSCDIDLLIRNHDSRRAFDITTAHGWLSTRDFHDQTRHHLPQQIKKQVALEIHTSLFGTVKHENDLLWKEFDRKNVNLELILLHVLNHAIRHHNFLNIETAIIDVGFILKHKNIDWDYFKFLEKSFKCRGLLKLFLSSFHEFFAPCGLIYETDTPQEIKDAFKKVSFDKIRSINNQFYVSVFFWRNWKYFIKTICDILKPFTPFRMSLRFKISKRKIIYFYPYFFIKTFFIRVRKFFKIRNYLKKELPQEKTQGSKTVVKIQDYIDRQN